MPFNSKPFNPSSIIKIEVIDKPEAYEFGEGEYEVKFGFAPQDIYYHDIISLDKLLKERIPDRASDILTLLQNMNTVYINTDTKEIKG